MMMGTLGSTRYVNSKYCDLFYSYNKIGSKFSIVLLSSLRVARIYKILIVSGKANNLVLSRT